MVVLGSGYWVVPASRCPGSSPGRTRTAGELPRTLASSFCNPYCKGSKYERRRLSRVQRSQNNSGAGGLGRCTVCGKELKMGPIVLDVLTRLV